MKKIIAVVSACLVVGLMGCKDKPVPPTETSSDINLKVTCQPDMNGQALSFDSIYVTDQGYEVKFTTIRFIWEDIQDQSGQILDAALFDYYDGTTVFNTTSTQVPTSLIGNLGVQQSLNHSDPAAFPVTSPLNILNASDMHWSWNPGYIFMKVEGYCDTIQDGTFTQEHVFSFHIGMDENLKILNFQSLNWNQTGGNSYELPMRFDMNTFLTNGSNVIDLRVESQAHSDHGQEALSTKVIENFRDALKLN